ncbi:MAG: hypothetical protein K8F91_10965, partial [Candidatus Obscuribacterales bacterium]|nr:hypothetical protein [Candidatus Obscuribacterales bacterium]
LVCTTTLIEGVNTKAQNIIVFDNKINKQKYDFFTFNNIRGRSGRMFKHFVGHVYLFHDPPEEDLPSVDIPALSQSNEAPESLLLQMEEEDLTPISRDKLKRFKEQPFLSFSTLRANVGIDPDGQINAAQTILGSLSDYHQALSWTQYPNWEQLQAVSTLVWDNFNGIQLGSGSVRSALQLATRINKLRKAPSITSLIEDQLKYEPDADKAVPAVLDFVRLWAGFHFPRLLRAVDRIQKDIFLRHKLHPGDYSFFAGQVENLFLDPALVALDEYGIPIELSRKLKRYLATNGDLDESLNRLKKLDLSTLRLSSFELELLSDTRSYLS